MAFPTTSILDNFNRADGAPGSNWTADIFGTTNPGPTGVVSNALKFNTFGRTMWWNVASFGPDSEVFCSVPTKPADGTGFLQLFARIQSAGTTGADAYKIELSPVSGTDTVDFYRVIDGVDTAIGSVSQEFSAGDGVGLEVTGTGATVTLKAYRFNGTSWSQAGSSVTDTNAARIVASGPIGIGSFQTTDTIVADDFGGGTVAAGATPSLIIPRRAHQGLIMTPPSY